MNLLLLINSPHLRQQITALAEQTSWQIWPLEEVQEYSNVVEKVSAGLDILLTDQVTLDLKSSLPVVYFGSEQTEKGWHQIPIEANLDEITRLIQTVVNLSRLNRKLTNVEDYEPTTRLPFERVLLESLANQQLKQATFLGIHIDHGEHLYSSLDPIAATDTLAVVARRLSSLLPENAHLGFRDAANFVCVIPNHNVEVAESLLKGFRKPLRLRANEAYVTASIGVVDIHSVQSISAHVRDAFVAMEQASQAGGNRIKILTEENDVLANKLPKALSQQEFGVEFQCQWHLSDRQIVGVEALVRWQGVDVGQLSPDRFIPLAERTGNITRIGDWVLNTACRQATTWLEHLPRPLILGINISPQQFHQGAIYSQIKELVEQNWFDPRNLELEMGQSEFTRVLDTDRQTLFKLRDLGVRMALDRFGSDLIEPSHLLRLPVDTIKIDKTLVSRIDTDKDAHALIARVLEMGAAYGLRVVAVGVETQEQAELLAHLGCVEAQGFYFSKPMPATAVRQIILDRQNFNTTKPHDDIILQ